MAIAADCKSAPYRFGGSSPSLPKAGLEISSLILKTFFYSISFLGEKKVFYDLGLRFSCNRCSDCCRLSPGVVYLSLEDLQNLCEVFGICESKFIPLYCRWLTYYDGAEVLALKERKNYDCILWKDGEGCSAYSKRPVQCSTYPFWSWILESREDWDSCAADCPGINAKNGRLWTKEEIEEQRVAYDKIEPLRRSEAEKLYGDLEM